MHIQIRQEYPAKGITAWPIGFRAGGVIGCRTGPNDGDPWRLICGTSPEQWPTVVLAEADHGPWEIVVALAEGGGLISRADQPLGLWASQLRQRYTLNPWTWPGTIEVRRNLATFGRIQDRTIERAVHIAVDGEIGSLLAGGVQSPMAEPILSAIAQLQGRRRDLDVFEIEDLRDRGGWVDERWPVLGSGRRRSGK